MTFVRHLRSAGCDVLASDIGKLIFADSVRCDLKSERQVAQLFEQHRFSTIVHLAAVLPTAFRSDPLIGGESEPFRHVAFTEGRHRFCCSAFCVREFGQAYTDRKSCTDAADPAPDDPYGAAKLAVEKILEQIPTAHSMETVSLRIARVLGPGAKSTANTLLQRQICRRFRLRQSPDCRLSMLRTSHVHCESSSRFRLFLGESTTHQPKS